MTASRIDGVPFEPFSLPPASEWRSCDLWPRCARSLGLVIFYSLPPCWVRKTVSILIEVSWWGQITSSCPRASRTWAAEQ